MAGYITLWTLGVGLIVIVVFSFIMVEFREMARVTLFGSRNKTSPNSTGVPFEAARDIPSLAGKVILITGAAGDLGRQTAIELARHGRPARIYVADLPRDEAAKKAVVDNIIHEAFGQANESNGSDTLALRTKVCFLELDLTSFESVRTCAAEFVAKEERLDILLLNAGIIRVATGTTKEGHEVHFGLNYLGHALLSRLLVPTLVYTTQQQPGADVRVVVVSSEGHAMAPKEGIHFDKLRTACADMSYTQRYGQSKMALICLTRELADHYPKLKTASVHPGRILTGMATALRKESFLVRVTAPIAPFFCVPVNIGVMNHLWAVTSPSVVSGMYYEPVGVPGKESAVARDKGLSKRLWEWTENELKSVKALR